MKTEKYRYLRDGDLITDECEMFEPKIDDFGTQVYFADEKYQKVPKELIGKKFSPAIHICNIRCSSEGYKLNEKLALLSGWKKQKPKKIEYYWAPGHLGEAESEWLSPEGYDAIGIPDFLNDLNETYKVEKLIYYDMGCAEEEAEKYESHLLNVICEDFGYQGAYLIVHASSNQKTRGLIRYFESKNS